MTKLVVCPLSEDPRSRRALPSAIDAAQLLGATLVLFRAVEDPHLVERSRDQLRRIAATHVAGDQEVAIKVVVDPHAPQAIAAEGTHPHVMIVMATSAQPLAHHGYLGSAAEHVIRLIERPALLVGPRHTTRLADVARAVATCDGSALSEAALPDAIEWHTRLDIPLWVTTCSSDTHSAQTAAESNYVRSLAEPLGAQWEVLHGHSTARTIADWSGDSLICATTHGRSGVSRFTTGSVAAGMTRWATGPILIRKAPRSD